MTTAQHSPARRRFVPLRRVLVALALSVGMAFTATPAMAVELPSRTAKIAMDVAMAQRGDPYRWGAAGPNAFDCSGLTQYAFAKAGKRLPHSSRMQSTMGRYVSKANLRPGDLVFFYRPVGHVAMYIGNGKIVHASRAGQPVNVTYLKYMYGYNTARRIA